MKNYNGADLRAMRKKLGLTQSEFWGPLRVTQSGASRYESGRDLPDPLQIVLNIAFGPERKVSEIVESLRSIGHPQKAAKHLG